jgi:hypothetical protein
MFFGGKSVPCEYFTYFLTGQKAERATHARVFRFGSGYSVGRQCYERAKERAEEREAITYYEFGYTLFLP